MWSFVVVSDIHVGSPRSFRYEPAWNENWKTAREQILEINPDLLLICGDLTRDGNIHRFELEAIKADLDTLPFPYYVVPGNMDTGNKHTDVSGPIKGRDDVRLNIRSEQLKQFSSIFGPLWWSFTYKDIRFSGFCDMIAGSGLPEEKDFWKWMEEQKYKPRAKYHVWIMHYALFIHDIHEPSYDIRDPKQYLAWYFGIDEPYRSRIFKVFKETNATIVINGHVHCRKTRYVDGIRFDSAPSTAFSQCDSLWIDGDSRLGFLRYDVYNDEIKCTFIPLKRISKAKGYGPRGHPPSEKLDYSIAWENN